MRALPFADGAFGSAINMFTSFGYFDDDDNARALNEIARVVGAAGVFVIDFINGRRVRARMQPASRRRVNDAMVEERRDLSADGRVLTKQVEVRWPDRDPVRYTERLRLYTHAELSGMLAGAGFRVREVHGDYELSAFEETESERLIMVCERLENR
jgi:SAM-dependent methyltransferase